jgi:hypothetical protein
MSELAPLDALVPRPPHYHSYLLRFWEERGDADTERIWRFMLQDPQTQERFGFADWDALTSWIREKILHRDNVQQT